MADRSSKPEVPKLFFVACLDTSSSPVPLKSRRVGQRCMLNLSRDETSSRWCGLVVRRGLPYLKKVPEGILMQGTLRANYASGLECSYFKRGPGRQNCQRRSYILKHLCSHRRITNPYIQFFNCFGYGKHSCLSHVMPKTIEELKVRICNASMTAQMLQNVCREMEYRLDVALTQELLETDLVILNHGQVTRTTLELASFNYHTTPTRGRLSSQQILRASLTYTAGLLWYWDRTHEPAVGYNHWAW
ncbi:hypothetical protein TNCV_2947371 [Trichonephila clavipes]|nr:hypothetical protein TNCV_2947371 [Trichonephila clavipes]